LDATLLAIASDAAGVTLRVRVTPRARREGVVGIHDGALRVAVRAPPERGKANQAVLDLLAAELGLPRAALAIASGAAARDKAVRITGIDAAELRRRLGAREAIASSATRSRRGASPAG
jgi:uncharacterized protein (TIGR00251 family)